MPVIAPFGVTDCAFALKLRLRSISLVTARFFLIERPLCMAAVNAPTGTELPCPAAPRQGGPLKENSPGVGPGLFQSSAQPPLGAPGASVGGGLTRGSEII